MAFQSALGYAVIKEGIAYTFGYNYYGQLGQTRNNRTGNANWQPQKIEGLPEGSTVRKVAMGHQHTAVLLTDGRLYTLGRNYQGALGVSNNWRNNNPNYMPLFVMDDVKEVQCGYEHTVVLKHNGDVYTFGRNDYGQLGIGTTGDRYAPQHVASNARKIAVHYLGTFYIDNNSDVYSCGYNSYGSLMNGNSSHQYSFVKSQVTGVKSIAGGTHHILFIKEDDSLWGYGYNYYGALGTSWNWRSGSWRREQKIMDNVKQVACGYHHTVFLTLDGKAYTVGYNAHGELGIGNDSDTWQPQHIASNARQVGASMYSSYVLKDDGTVLSTGYNRQGQLGVSYYAGSSSDVRIWQTLVGNWDSLCDFNTDILLSRLSSNSDTTHKDEITFSTDVDHHRRQKCQYRFKVGNQQVFPKIGWTNSQDVPFVVNKILQHTVFEVGENTVIIEVQDEDGFIDSMSTKVTKTNENPGATVLLSAGQIHKDNVQVTCTFSDPEYDLIRYKLLLNGEHKYPGEYFSEFKTVPHEFSWILKNHDFNVGLNVVEVILEDEFGGTINKKMNVIKTNAVPTVTGEVLGAFADIEVDDGDGDKVQYRIIVNGTQVFPELEMTDFLEVPFQIKYRIPEKYINLNETNKVRIEAKDELGGLTAWEFNFEGIMSGLLFCDANETYYSTNFGELLKYLDFGTITAGQTTLAERVWVKNTLGYPVSNIRLGLDQRELDGAHAKAEISEFDSPFEGGEGLIYSEVLQHNEKISFYVRIVTDRQAMWGGMFDIKAKADPY